MHTPNREAPGPRRRSEGAGGITPTSWNLTDITNTPPNLCLAGFSKVLWETTSCLLSTLFFITWGSIAAILCLLGRVESSLISQVGKLMHRGCLQRLTQQPHLHYHLIQMLKLWSWSCCICRGLLGGTSWEAESGLCQRGCQGGTHNPLS